MTSIFFALNMSSIFSGKQVHFLICSAKSYKSSDYCLRLTQNMSVSVGKKQSKSFRPWAFNNIVINAIWILQQQQFNQGFPIHLYIIINFQNIFSRIQATGCLN